jgi:hypothetical protein
MATIPETTTTVQFDATLRTLAEAAHARYAGEAARIDRGLVIALNGGVTLHQDGTASVQSCSNTEVVYHVAHGTCDCPDFQRAPGGRCKHRFAVCLVKKAQRQAVRHYALYTAPDGTAHDGIATQTGQGWLFVAEDGLDPLFASSAALVLYGQVDIAEAALAHDTRVEGSRVLTLLAR